MRRFALAATLSIAAFSLAGCKSQQEREQEQLTALKAKYTTMMDVYLADCTGLGMDRGNAPRVAKCDAEETRIRPLEAQIKALSEKIAAH